MAAGHSIGSDPDTEIGAVDFEEYRGVLGVDIPTSPVTFPCRFNPPLDCYRSVQTNPVAIEQPVVCQ